MSETCARSANEIFDDFYEKNRLFLDKIVSNPLSISRNPWEILGNGSYCSCNDFSSSREIRRTYVCRGCELTNILTGSSKEVGLEMSEVFTIECGYYKGTTIKTDTVKNIPVIYDVSLSFANSLNSIISNTPYSLLRKCLECLTVTHRIQEDDKLLSINSSFDLSDLARTIHLQTDNVTNETIVNIALNRILSGGWGILTSIPLYGAYRCRDYTKFLRYDSQYTIYNFIRNSKNFEEKRTPGEKDRLKRSILLSILGQLISTLHVLQNTYQFIHGMPTINSIEIDEIRGSDNYNYDDVKIETPFNLMITRFSKSSLTLMRSADVSNYSEKPFIRVSPVDSMTSENLSASRPILSISSDSGIIWYSLPSSKDYKWYQSVQHSGIPLYLSFDTYSFLLSLATIPEFYHSIQENSDLRNIWNNLFHKTDLPTIEKRLHFFHENPSNISIETLFSGINLRCDATNYLWNSIKIFFS